MNATATIDKAGRVVIPKAMRDEMQLDPGDTLELECSGDQLSLRPARGTAPLKKERGIWVFRTGRPLPASAVRNAIREIREERYRRAAGQER
mgnify:FL=1